MNAARRLLYIALTLLIASVSYSQNASAPDADGLVKKKVSGLQSVYARPDADLSRYAKVMLDPISVSFSKSWERQTDPRRPTDEEKQAIQQDLDKVLREELGRELARSGRYRLVDASGPEVLRIKADIRDLYINAPDVPRAGISRNYTRSAGEMTLVAELRDASNEALLARVTDRVKDPETAWLELTTKVDNIAAARRAAANWARILRTQLDAAHEGQK